MTGGDAKDWVSAFSDLIKALAALVKSPDALTILLLIAVMAMAFWVWRLSKHKVGGLEKRLNQCEAGHKACTDRERETELRNADRERRNLLAIAALHGIIKSVESKLPETIEIPSLQELFSVRWSMAQENNAEVKNLDLDAGQR